MPVKRVDPPEAAQLVEQGWKYVDVRSVPEFEQGHPEGAYNVPLLHFVPGQGMVPNPEFAEVFRANFGKDENIVVGCKVGGRSARAAEMLAASGYGNVVDMRGGFAGEMNQVGQIVCEGWAARGLPVSRTPRPERTWEALRKNRPAGR